MGATMKRIDSKIDMCGRQVSGAQVSSKSENGCQGMDAIMGCSHG